MPRLPRPVVADVPLHIIQRGNNRLQCFFGDSDYLVYLDLLKRCAFQADCRVHAYVLMTNHVHLLVTPLSIGSPAAMMKSLGQRYVQYVNRRYSRTGSLWEGRYKSSLVEHERYLLICQRYIELNPVRARMVTHPSHYPWSSYRVNAHGAGSKLITPHPTYLNLAHAAIEREIAYRKLFDIVIPTSILNKVRRATNGNFALGNKQFTTDMAHRLGRQVTPLAAGRPRAGQHTSH
jgi:putative transposase